MEPGTERVPPGRVRLEEHEHSLGEHERDVALEPVLQAYTLTGDRVPRLRHVDQHHIAVDARREPSELVRPLVERPTRLQVESRVVPVAREDPVADRSAVQWEAHVRAPVVDGVHVVAVGEEADDVMVVMDHEPPGSS